MIHFYGHKVTTKEKIMQIYDFFKKNFGMCKKLKIRMRGKIFYKIQKSFSLSIVHQMFSIFCEF
jgi:hypothetical protein